MRKKTKDLKKKDDKRKARKRLRGNVGVFFPSDTLRLVSIPPLTPNFSACSAKTVQTLK